VGKTSLFSLLKVQQVETLLHTPSTVPILSSIVRIEEQCAPYIQ